MKLHYLTTLLATAALLALQPMAAEKGASISTIEKVRADLVSLDSLVLGTSDALQRVKDSAKNPGN